MKRSGLGETLLAFVTFAALSLTPISAFAQHGGGGGGHSGGGGGGSAHGGGGASSGARPSGGSYGGGSYGHGGDSRGESSARSDGNSGRSYGGPSSRGMDGRSMSGRSMSGRNGGNESGRNSASEAGRSSNIHAAINDGQWHSFGGASSAHGASTGTLSARNTGANANWHNFGTSGGRGASFGGGFRGSPYYGFHGGFGGCCWGRGYGYGWGGWGFGFGSPYFAFGWGPWYGSYFFARYYYGPYYYSPWPSYSYDLNHDDYSYDWSTNPPPYRPDSSLDDNARGNGSTNDKDNNNINAEQSDLTRPTANLDNNNDDDQEFDNPSSPASKPRSEPHLVLAPADSGKT
jgi:hypothetical protein